MNVVIINPPLVQLNSPYPSGAYLSAFFKKMNGSVLWKDLSIELFYSIFSKDGLTKLFSLSEETALKMADKAENNGDEITAFNLRRYISNKAAWINWIDFITTVLQDGNKNYSTREKEHQFLYSPFAPRGNRMDNYLANLSKEPDVDDLRFLCSYALADLSDYITAVFDKEFSLIRYAEALTVDESSLIDILTKIDSPVMKEFYAPVLDKVFSNSKGDENNAFELMENNPEKTLVCISIPFAGTFVPALYTARYLKQQFGNKVFVVIGGGFVNTELREASEEQLADFIDAISYDRGYGSYKALLENPKLLSFEKSTEDKTKTGSLYKLRLFQKNKEVIITEPLWNDPDYEAFEAETTAALVPDYSDIDFSPYLRVCDDKNPMHRLWTDGTWIKAYLAHGCYWHKCAFCDTKLDYVCSYKPVNVEALYEGLKTTAESKNIYGIHFVDEALPAASLKKFALLNARDGNPLYYWGNVRFEKSFSKDLAVFLSYCGFGGVSAGLEVATGTGLKNINKGTDIDSIVSACAAFKEAGILVHAYMIYGFWYDTPQSIIDSMETLRQFFAAGLLDSAFWHKFVLTRNSSVYDSLKDRVKENKQSKALAKNNVHFEGEEKYEKYGLPLESALDAWMHGDKLEMKVQKWFDFPMPSPSIQRDYIEKIIEKYETSNNSRRFDFSKLNPENDNQQLFWLGSNPVMSSSQMIWYYLQEEQAADLRKDEKNLPVILWALRPGAVAEERKRALVEIKKSPNLQKLIQGLHNSGIVFI